MATPPWTPNREPGPSYSLTSSPPPRRTQYTFSTQRAEFTKPVPAALLPVYPTFAEDLDSDDEAAIADTLTKPMVIPQKNGTSTAEGNSQRHYQEMDTMATVGQTTLVCGSAEKSGISPTPNLTSLRTTNRDRSPGEIDDRDMQQEKNSNSVMARLASLLGLQKRQERRPVKSSSNAVPSSMEAPLPDLSYSNDTKYFPFPSPSRSDALRFDSSLSANNRINAEGRRNMHLPAVIEDDREFPCDSAINGKLKLLGVREPSKQRKQGQGYASATYPTPVRFLHHHRSRSLDISRAPATSLHASNQTALIIFTQEVPSHSRSRSRSMDDQRCGKTTSTDGSLWRSSYHVPPVSVPPNCVLVQVSAIGLDDGDRQLVVGSDGCIIDAHLSKRSQEAASQGWGKCKERRDDGGTHSIFNGPKSLDWTLDFGAKKKVEWLTVPGVEPLSMSMSNLQSTNKNRIVQDVSLPKTPQSLEAGCIPGQSFVGRVLGVGSAVDISFAARDDWIVGLADIRKCGPLAEFIVIDWRQVYRVPTPYEHCSLDNAGSTCSTLVPELTSGKLTEDVEDKPPFSHFAPLAFDELALLPLCGIPAYRAVKTCIVAFPAGHNGGCVLDGPTGECSHPTHGQRRRALVLRGHDGVGAMAVQMLVRQGWRVSVHVPFSRVPWDASQAEADGFMLAIENRLKGWGADEVIYDDGISYTNWDGEMDDRKAAVVRVIETLRGDGDVFDAVLDFVGGKETRAASEKLLKLNGCPAIQGDGQFTTLLGANALDDPIPTLADNLRLNVANLSTSTLHTPRSYTYEQSEVFKDTWSGDMGRRALIEGAFDPEEEEVWEMLGSVLRLAVEDGIRPHVEEAGGELFGRRRSVSVEKALGILVDGDLLSDGGTLVVRMVR